MVTSLFVYLFPDYYYFFLQLESHRGTTLGIVLCMANVKGTCSYAQARPGIYAPPAFLDSGHLLSIHIPSLQACLLGPFKAGIP